MPIPWILWTSRRWPRARRRRPPDAAEHAARLRRLRRCRRRGPRCLEGLLDAVARASEAPADLADRVLRVRPFSRAERGASAVWRAPLAAPRGPRRLRSRPDRRGSPGRASRPGSPRRSPRSVGRSRAGVVAVALEALAERAAGGLGAGDRSSRRRSTGWAALLLLLPAGFALRRVVVASLRAEMIPAALLWLAASSAARRAAPATALVRHLLRRRPRRSRRRSRAASSRPSRTCESTRASPATSSSGAETCRSVRAARSAEICRSSEDGCATPADRLPWTASSRRPARFCACIWPRCGGRRGRCRGSRTVWGLRLLGLAAWLGVTLAAALLLRLAVRRGRPRARARRSRPLATRRRALGPHALSGGRRGPRARCPRRFRCRSCFSSPPSPSRRRCSGWDRSFCSSDRRFSAPSRRAAARGARRGVRRARPAFRSCRCSGRSSGARRRSSPSASP